MKDIMTIAYLKITYMMVFIFFPTIVMGQEDIKVESFGRYQTTNYANLEGCIEYDANGEKCALIIVDTKYPELLTFSGGSLGITKVVPKTGQVWVYVPDGFKRITISGKDMGTLRDYDLGMSVSKARTYILKLTTKDIISTPIDPNIKKTIRIKVVSEKDNVPIPEADISINGMKETLDKRGILEKQYLGATYRYLVESTFYKSTSGTFVVDGKIDDVIIKMKPNYEMATISAPQDCEIWVDGQKKSVGAWSGKMTLGTHTIACKLANHYDYAKSITVTEGSPINVQLEKPKEIQGELKVTSMPTGAEIFIDGHRVGTTPYIGSMLIGSHVVEVMNKGYVSFKDNVTIVQNQRIDVNAVLKQTRRVKFSTSPVNATIVIDRKKYQAPFNLDMQLGSHEFIVQANGYYTLKKNVTITGDQHEVKFHLQRAKYKQSEFYVGGGYSVMPIAGIQACIGGYINKFNVELGYLKGMADSDLIYWYTSDSDNRPAEATYTATKYHAKFGYGLVLNNLFRLTPQLGISHLTLKEDVNDTMKYADGAYTSNVCVGLKLDIALTTWLVLNFVADYSMAMKKSEGYEALENVSDHFTGLSQGLGIYTGINVKF